MKLSIITINRNNAEGLRRTIRSVAGQTCRDFEYIVIDGASNDESKDVITEHQSAIGYWVSEPDKGVYNAMNKGVAQAHGDYCLFINSGDELAHSRVVEKVLPRLKGMDFYAGDTLVDYGKKRGVMKSPYRMTVDFIVHRSVSHPATFTRTQLLRENPYNEENKIVSDWEFFFYEWLFRMRSYERIDNVVSVFYYDGISSVSPELVTEERQAVMDRLLSRNVQSLFDYHSDLERKIMQSLHKHPVERDWKVLRNGVKYFFKDLFVDDKIVSGEVKRVALEVLPERIVSHILYKEGLEKKIELAMAKFPLQRDWKLIRNAFKYLIKDIFVTLKS